MKKVFLLLLLVPFLFVMVGCEEDPVEEIDPPSGLVLAGASNEYYLVISWTASSTSDIDGYRVYYNGSATPIYENTSTTFTHGDGTNAPALGDYEIKAYRGEEESDALTFDTATRVKTGSFVVCDWLGPDESGVWINKSTGVATLYSMTATATDGHDKVDFYYDSDISFNSGTLEREGEPNWYWDKHTAFNVSSSTYDDLDVVDIADYYDGYFITEGQILQVIYWETTPSTWNYGKFRIDSISGHNATVTFAIQTIKGWARID